MTLRLAPLALALLLTACGSARPDGDGEPPLPEATPIETLVDSLDARLDLSADQREAVRVALDTRRTDVRRAQNLPTRVERQAASERARTEADARILAALTRAQQATYTELRAERPADLDPAISRRLDRYRQRLDLSDEQADAIAEILQDEVDEVEAIVARYRREGGREIPAVREEISAVRERTEDLIRAELTETQAEAFAGLREEGRRGRR